MADTVKVSQFGTIVETSGKPLTANIARDDCESANHKNKSRTSMDIPLESAELASHMRLAIEEGRKAVATCEDNPPVGCVLVLAGSVVARGHTNPPGKPHAEAMAISQLAARNDEVIAFVTLEPCSFHGRTPSCAQALIEAGIKRVYVGIIDPDSRNNGRGIAQLREAGIEVHVGVLAQEIATELSGYLGKAL